MVASSSLSYCAYEEGPAVQRARIRQSIEEKRFRAVGFGFNNYTPTLKLVYLTEIIKRHQMVIGAAVQGLRENLLTCLRVNRACRAHRKFLTMRKCEIVSVRLLPGKRSGNWRRHLQPRWKT